MTTNEKQVEFMRTLAAFLMWCFQNEILVIGGELFRSPEQAAINALPNKSTIRAKVFKLLGLVLKRNRKVGIKGSVHRHKCAIDLFRYLGGTVTWRAEDYQSMGDKWKSMHPLARWGGDFRNRDVFHFSFEHRGVM